jgi:hypothetical protein
MKQNVINNRRKSVVESLRRQYANYRLFRVWAEWCSPGLWMPNLIGEIAVGKCIEPEQIAVSLELRARFKRWQEDYDAQNPPTTMMEDDEQCIFDAEGLNLAIQLSYELDAMSIVEYEIGEQHLLFNQGDCVCTFIRPIIAD